MDKRWEGYNFLEVVPIAKVEKEGITSIADEMIIEKIVGQANKIKQPEIFDSNRNVGFDEKKRQ